MNVCISYDLSTPKMSFVNLKGHLSKMNKKTHCRSPSFNHYNKIDHVNKSCSISWTKFFNDIIRNPFMWVRICNGRSVTEIGNSCELRKTNVETNNTVTDIKVEGDLEKDCCMVSIDSIVGSSMWRGWTYLFWIHKFSFC